MAEAESDEAKPGSSIAPHSCLFPSALVPLLRERLPGSHPSLVGVGDDLLEELINVVFFAGLETQEGVHYPVRVAFAGRITAEVLLPEDEAPDTSPMLLYRWSTLRIEPDRPFSVAALVKLGVVTRSERMYTKVELSDRGLRVAGLTREGVNREGDPYLKIVAPRPGVLSIRRGNQALLEYEHGRVGASSEDVVLVPGVVRRALEAAALNAHLGDASIGDYLNTVRAIVREMAAHGNGGILVISRETHPELPAGISYRTPNGSAIAQFLHYLDGAADARRAAGSLTPNSPGGPGVQLRRVLRGAFLSEVERWVSEFGAFTAMDGATILDCALGLRGFGVVLPVARDIEVVEATDPEATFVTGYDLWTRGARHRAAVTYARKVPGSVVFIASQDGPVSCLFSERGGGRVILWRLGSGEFL